MITLLAAACEACGDEPLGWPAAVAIAASAAALAVVFYAVAKYQ